MCLTVRDGKHEYRYGRSTHPTAHKVAVVRTLMTWAVQLSSSGVEQAEEEKQVVNALRGNGYLSGFVHKHTTSGRRREEAEDQRPRTILTLSYISGLSEAIRLVLKPLEIKAVFCPMRPLRQIQPKDPVLMEEWKGVVYSIACEGCPKVYTGQTGRCLKQRVSEHQRAFKKGDVRTSALDDHVLEIGHAVDLSKSWY